MSCGVLRCSLLPKLSPGSCPFTSTGRCWTSSLLSSNRKPNVLSRLVSELPTVFRCSWASHKFYVFPWERQAKIADFRTSWADHSPPCINGSTLESDENQIAWHSYCKRPYLDNQCQLSGQESPAVPVLPCLPRSIRQHRELPDQVHHWCVWELEHLRSQVTSVDIWRHDQRTFTACSGHFWLMHHPSHNLLPLCHPSSRSFCAIPYYTGTLKWQGRTPP